MDLVLMIQMPAKLACLWQGGAQIAHCQTRRYSLNVGEEAGRGCKPVDTNPRTKPCINPRTNPRIYSWVGVAITKIK